MQLIRLVDMLELALGDEALGTARRQLRELDATSAMDVLKLLDQTAKRWSLSRRVTRGQISAVNNAERRMRDIVVMFLVNRGGADAIRDRRVFLDTAEDINGAPLDRDIQGKSYWLTINSCRIAEEFGLEREPSTNQDWVSRLADGVANSSRDTGEPQTATWTGKDWACHRADIQGICLS